MKKIGTGYYYHVYDLGNDRVLKMRKNNAQIFLYILFVNGANIKNTFKEFWNVLNALPRIRSIYKDILSKGSVCTELLGNPMLLDEINYVQDKVSVIKDKIADISEEQFSLVVNDYINLVKKLWSFCVNDSVYNFTLNNGYNRNNKLVLIDFNEATFNIEEVSRDIQNKIWLERSSYLYLEIEKKDIFKELMGKEITEENLKKHWGRQYVPHPGDV